MDKLEQNLIKSLCTLVAIAKRREKISGDPNRDISLGEKDLVHNFIAYLFMYGDDGLSDYYKNSWGIFAPEVQYSLDILVDKEILRDDDKLIYFNKRFFDLLKTDSTLENTCCGYLNTEKLDSAVEHLYPADDEDKKGIDYVKANVRIASLMNISGHSPLRRVWMEKYLDNDRYWDKNTINNADIIKSLKFAKCGVKLDVRKDAFELINF